MMSQYFSTALLADICKVWRELEGVATSTPMAGNCSAIPYLDLCSKIGTLAGATELIMALHSGETLIIKGALRQKHLADIFSAAISLQGSGVSIDTRQKVTHGCSNYHCRVDESSVGFQVVAKKEVFNFFRGSDGSADLFAVVDPVWNHLKILTGISHQTSIPSASEMGFVDRIQVVRYPVGGGAIAWHQDSADHQKFIIGCILSLRGRDYKEGGLELLGSNGESCAIEGLLTPGDIVLFNPRLMHRVAPIDTNMQYDSVSRKGRWFMGMYSMLVDPLL